MKEMRYEMTEDEVRDIARTELGLGLSDEALSDVGQLTSFNRLGLPGIKDRPDGWYLPNDTNLTAIILEVKGSNVTFTDKERAELLKNIKITNEKYKHVVGILYNGYEIEVYKGTEPVVGQSNLKGKEYYLSLFSQNKIDKALIYSLTRSINDTLHFDFKIKNLYHRMIFTACALVAKRYGAPMYKGMSFAMFSTAIRETLASSFSKDLVKNIKLQTLLDVFSEIKMNASCSQESINRFILDVEGISDNIVSQYWNGEDVMAIFFNEFNRYKAKSESGQVFTPDHITSFVYRITDTNSDDFVLDAACGSGAFLVKSMCNMIKDVGGANTNRAKQIAETQLYGIEYDREIYALACANMLIHKDGKTNLELMDSRTPEAGLWIKSKPISKVLMNPPFENKYGCLDIVANVLANVQKGTTCAFILPDNKLEKARAKVRRWLKACTLEKIIKLPKEIFSGVTTSIFIFKAGIPQSGKEIFTCYMAEDGLETIKNQGRQDIRNRWDAIEDKWVEIIHKLSGHESIQWIKPDEHLSYQEEFKVTLPVRSDFMKRALSYVLYKMNIDENSFSTNVKEHILYDTNILSEYKVLIDKEESATIPLDNIKWKMFKINELFYIRKGQRLTKAAQKAGNINYVGASAFNNGVTNHIGNTENLNSPNTISVCYNGSIGEAFYQEDVFWATDDVNVLVPKFIINKYIALFFCTVIKNESKKYTFNNKWTKDIMEKSMIPLPVTKDNKPDFTFMEKYISSLPYLRILDKTNW
ncbi:MAG: N-6 DNA methylase [Prevotella sp.]